MPERVLMTCDAVGGVWTYALELIQELGARGVTVALATMGGPLRPAQREEARRLPNLCLFESDYRLEWMQEPWEDCHRAGEWLLELESAFGPDVVHLNGYVHGALPWRAPVLVVAHSCVLSWWQACRGGEAPQCWDRYRDEVARGIAGAGMLVAPSGAMLEAVQCHYGCPAPGRVVYNGRNPSPFQPTSKEPFVLSAGRIWDEAKNVRALERVADQLAWPVYLAGDAAHPEGGQVQCRGVCLLGQLSGAQLASWFARASVYALPARYEPFGLTALEAALAGCALVLGDIPSLREIWGDAALFVDPDDPQALLGALRELIEDPSRRLRMAGRSIERARGFSPERMAQGYVEAYGQLLRPAESSCEAIPTVNGAESCVS